MVAATLRPPGYGAWPSANVAVFAPRQSITRIPLIYCAGFAAPASRALALREVLGTVDTGVQGVCADLGSPAGQTWGNDSGRTALGDLITWAGANLGTRTDKVALLAESMGALTAINYARANLGQVAAMALSIPAVDLQKVHDRNLLGMGPSIEAAYGGLSGYQAALTTHSPALQPTAISSIAGKTKAWYSATDNVTLPAEVTAWASVAGVTAVNIGSVGHTGPTDAGYYQLIIDWLAPLCWWG